MIIAKEKKKNIMKLIKNGTFQKMSKLQISPNISNTSDVIELNAAPTMIQLIQ